MGLRRTKWAPSKYWMEAFEEALVRCKAKGLVKETATTDNLIALYSQYWFVIRVQIRSLFFPKIFVPGLGKFNAKPRDFMYILNAIDSGRMGYQWSNDEMRLILRRIMDSYFRNRLASQLRRTLKNRKKRSTYEGEIDYSKEKELGRGPSGLPREFLIKSSSVIKKRGIDIGELELSARYGVGENELLRKPAHGEYRKKRVRRRLLFN